MTLDGWELVLLRITGIVDEEGNVFDLRRPEKPPVLFVHGQDRDALSWLDGADGKPVMFELVDAGYDVWMGNSRASAFSYCVSHIADSCSDTGLSFWRMGRFDDPAMVNEIRRVTGHPKITYIGYSMGNTQLFYSISKKGESYWTERLHNFIALAPCNWPATSDLADIQTLHVHFMVAEHDENCPNAGYAYSLIPSPNKSWHLVEQHDHYYFDWASPETGERLYLEKLIEAIESGSVQVDQGF